jgi:hypothetical protein
MAFCNFCGWVGSVLDAKRRVERHYEKDYIIFSCPNESCGADITYSLKKEVEGILV